MTSLVESAVDRRPAVGYIGSLEERFLPNDDSGVRWDELAEFVSGPEQSRLEVGGTRVAQRVLCQFVSDEMLRGAVEWCLYHRPGSETARSVLRHLRSPVAVAECVRLLNEAVDADVQEAAARVMADVAEESVLPHVAPLLEHVNPGVQRWAAKSLDELMMIGAIDESDLLPWLAKLDAHANPAVREVACALRQIHLADEDPSELS